MRIIHAIRIYVIIPLCCCINMHAQSIRCDFFMSLTCDKCHNFLCNTLPHLERNYHIQFVTHIMFFDHASFLAARLLFTCTNELLKRSILQKLFKNLSSHKPHVINPDAVNDICRTYNIALSPAAHVLEMQQHYQQCGITHTPTFHINGYALLNEEDLCRYINEYFNHLNQHKDFQHYAQTSLSARQTN